MEIWAHQYCSWTAVAFRFSHTVNCKGAKRFEKFSMKPEHCTSRSKIEIWQCVRVWSALSPLWRGTARLQPLAAAQLSVLLISLRLKTLHVPWKPATQSGDIDRATLRWVFLCLPVCGSWTEDGGGDGALCWPTQDNKQSSRNSETASGFLFKSLNFISIFLTHLRSSELLND